MSDRFRRATELDYWIEIDRRTEKARQKQINLNLIRNNNQKEVENDGETDGGEEYRPVGRGVAQD